MTATGQRRAAADGPPADSKATDGTATDRTAGEAPPTAPEPDAVGVTAALPKLVKLAGEVIAPATLLTALLFQFGRLHAAGYYRHFGVNFSVLDLTTTDHLIAGADGLFVPLAGACVLALLLIWLHRFVLTRLSDRSRTAVLTFVTPAAALAGVLLLGLALLDLLAGVRPVWDASSEAGGLSLAVGVLLLVYALRLLRLTHGTPPRSPGSELAEWGAAFLLVSVGLYWAVGVYAFGVGTGRAQQLERALPAQPAAVLFSERSQSLDVVGVTEVRCADPEAAYRFRYDGLRLVRQAGNQYLLVAAAWTRDTGTAVLVPRGAGVRLEFRTADAPAGSC